VLAAITSLKPPLVTPPKATLLWLRRGRKLKPYALDNKECQEALRKQGNLRVIRTEERALKPDILIT
jgi:hypothetical protein